MNEFLFFICVLYLYFIKQICEVYENIVFIVSREDHKNGEGEDDDNDTPTLDKNSSITYLKDAFEISDVDHEKIVNDYDSQSNSIQRPRRDKFEVLEAHVTLIKILLKHELVLSQTPEYYWHGNPSFITKEILKIHSEYEKIDNVSLTFAQWFAYADVHKTNPLNPTVFIDLLDKITVVYIDKNRATLDMKLINSTKKIIPACFGIATMSDKNFIKSNGKQQIGTFFDHLKTEDRKIVEMFWTAARNIGESFLNFLIEINSNEDLDNVKREILLSYFELLNRIRKIDSTNIEDVFFENFDNSMRLAVTGGICKYIDNFILNNNLESPEKIDLEALMKFVDFVKGNYLKFSDKFAKLFKE
jgi:hypothetical protein